MAASTVSAFGQSETDLDRYGGWRGRQVAPTGWFHVAEVDGRWRLIDPEGHQFLSIGVNTVSFRQDADRTTNQSPYGQAVSEKYGRPRDWASATSSSNPSTWAASWRGSSPVRKNAQATCRKRKHIR